jgi:hypothetical protein
MLFRNRLVSARDRSIPGVVDWIGASLDTWRETMYENGEEIGLLEDFDD